MDGSPDIGLGTRGWVALPVYGKVSVALQGDGKIVVAGSRYTRARGGVFALARYNVDGSLDRTFGKAGIALADFGPRDDQALAVTIQPDRKIVAAGSPFGPYGVFELSRFNQDGSLDPGFGRGGKVMTNFASKWGDDAAAVAIQGDGRIVVAGRSGRAGGDVFALARYNAGGRLDRSFGRGGKAVTAFSSPHPDDEATAVAIQGDGKIVAAGRSNAGKRDDFALARYNADGSLDAGFGRGGKVVTDFGSSARHVTAVAIQGDGKIVAAGSNYGSGRNFVLVRYKVDGSLDPSFGGGKAVTAFGSSRNGGAEGVALQRDGRIVATGSSDAGGSDDFALARYNPDGSLDSHFGAEGSVLTDFAAAHTWLISLSATRTRKGVLVRWRTGAEVDTRGFNVYRERKPRSAGWTRANPRLLPGEGDANHGAAYAFLDKRAPHRAALRYWLREVRRDGAGVDYGPAGA